MRLNPNSLAMTGLLASLTALGPLATDIYVPSLPQIARVFGGSTASAQFTITGYLMGFAVGQIIYGPLSDKYGRRPVVLFGLALYIAATLACIFAASIDALVGARVVQALGAAAPIILSRAIVRDLYEGARAARQFAQMSMIIGVTPIGAPVLGGFLQSWYGWQASFVVMLITGAAIAAGVIFLLPETNTHKQEGPLSLGKIITSFGIVARNRAYLSYLGIQACCYNGLFAFVSASSVVMQGSYGLAPTQFGFVFAICASSFVFGAWLGSRLVSRRGLEGMIRLGVACLCAGGLLQIAALALFPHSIAALVIPEMLYFIGVGFLLPNTLAAAMTPFPERAGAASSLMGFAQMTSGALVGSLLGALLGESAWPLAIVTAIAGVGGFVIFHLSKDARRATITHSGNLVR